MSTFTARVELHNANPTDYTKLYTEMQEESLVAAGKKAESGNGHEQIWDTEPIEHRILELLK